MYIDVLIETYLNNNDMTYTYHLNNKDNDIIGKRVIVPFGSRKVYGFVLGISKKPVEYEAKEVIEVVDKKSVLNKELLDLGIFMKNKYLCSLISIYQSMLPKALKARSGKTVNIKTQSYVKLNKDIKEFNTKIKSQLEIINYLKDNDLVLKSNIKSKSSLKKLIEKNIVIEVKKECFRYDKEITEKKEIILNDKQEYAVNNILNNEDNLKPILLYGVTGSGKTEVYINVIKKILEKNKTAIVLVPEISLTPQITNRFKSVFKDDIAVLHSSLSDGEKYDEYRKIKDGKVKIVIGARSAVFAPLKNIGIIIIDEEHSESYKQENNPRYTTFDIAQERTKNHKAILLLGSATPKIETYAKAKFGYFKLIKLEKRVNNREMPKVEIINMKDEVKKKNRIFSSRLILEIQDRLNKKEQVMILLNRRGYSNYLSCMSCGDIRKCPNCDITLTYYKTSNMLRCNYCGYAENSSLYCPLCKEKSMRQIGIGTEKIEEELNNIFKDSKVIRMDRDTTSKKNSHENIIKDFANQKYDILVGTQMISKGLNFPNVTLVGVINTDLSLNIPNFRSSENTYSLLDQVIGRAGRANKKGSAIVQTFNPEHYSILYSSKHDYEGFFEKELKIRKKLFYPPYCHIALIKITSLSYEDAKNESNKIGKYLKNVLKNEIILGPSVSGILKINNKYSFQIIVKYKTSNLLLEELKNILNMYLNTKKISIIVDFDAINI